MKYRSLRKTSGKHLWPHLSERMSSMVEDHRQQRDENLGVNFEYYPSVDGKNNTVLYSMGHYFHHQSHPKLGGVAALVPSLHSFCSYFSTDLQQHIGHLLTWGVHLSVSYLFAFSYCSQGSQLPFPSPVDRVLSELFTMTSLSQVALQGMAHSFIELDKAVVHVIRLVSFL